MAISTAQPLERVSATYNILMGYWQYLHALTYRAISLRNAQDYDLSQESETVAIQETFAAFDAASNFAKSGFHEWRTCLDCDGQSVLDESGQPVRYPITPQTLTRLAGEIKSEYGFPIPGARQIGIDVTPERISDILDAYKVYLEAIDGAVQKLKSSGNLARMNMYRKFFFHQAFTAINSTHHFIETGNYIAEAKLDQNDKIVYNENGNPVMIPQSPEAILSSADNIRSKQF